MDIHGMGVVSRHPKVEREARTPLPGALWWAVVRRDDFTCQWCGLRSTEPSHLEVDHLIPYSAGGLDNTPNLRVLCVPCNQARSNFATWEWDRPTPIVATCQGTTAEAAAARITVFCMAHGRPESVPDYFAQAYELARTHGRPTPARPADPNQTGSVLDLPMMELP